MCDKCPTEARTRTNKGPTCPCRTEATLQGNTARRLSVNEASRRQVAADKQTSQFRSLGAKPNEPIWCKPGERTSTAPRKQQPSTLICRKESCCRFGSGPIHRTLCLMPFQLHHLFVLCPFSVRALRAMRVGSTLTERWGHDSPHSNRLEPVLFYSCSVLFSL